MGPTDGATTADNLVIMNAMVNQSNSAECLNHYPYAPRQTRAKDHCIQRVSFHTQIRPDRAIIEGAWERGDKIQASGGTSLQETASGNLYGHFEFWRTFR